LKKIIVAILLISTSYCANAQHIEYRDKRKPVESKAAPADDPVPVPKPIVKVEEKKIVKDTVAKPVAVIPDTSSATISKAKFTMNPRPKKPYVEEQNMCDLMSRPEVAPTLPLVINKVSPEMVKMLKARYEGRLYSITGLNMIDVRLKFKLKICDKDQGKFRSEYLDKDGNVVKDPDLDYE
jgi:hypothetical protein